MELSIRLKSIINLMDSCSSIVDVGTDHGYIPIYAVKNGICKTAIASDINSGPLKKAEKNIVNEELKDKIYCRKGGGLSTVSVDEVEALIIAGMGGNLIRDILLEDIEKVKRYEYIILQPAQNPEVLREFLYKNSFEVIDEDICIDEGKFYELFKVKYIEDVKDESKEDTDYEISPYLIKKKHPLILDYIEYKILYYEKIKNYILEDTEAARERKNSVQCILNRLEELRKCLLKS
ncbi:tRNA (adenine(22)-N(1))-methyltransferase [Clostridium polynesiense]|uniref:tRNA (adenine(22)-N(1))-methyltransferase n=1 Tax=Clostridium polynesiense TaxID=1325933 RepID=UPI00058CB9AE|nr:class I SAM-dependent methyltransferase [Clostridium polynesiense]